jgi:hypothetical protein
MLYLEDLGRETLKDNPKIPHMPVGVLDPSVCTRLIWMLSENVVPAKWQDSVVRPLVYQPIGPGSIQLNSCSDSAIKRANPIMLLPPSMLSSTTC